MEPKYKMTSSDVLKLSGNILRENGINNIKFVNILLAAFNIYLKLYEDTLKLNYLDDLEGVMLDLYAKIFGLYRNNVML